MAEVRVWLSWFRWRFFCRGRNRFLPGACYRTLERCVRTKRKWYVKREWQDGHPIYSGAFYAEDE